MQKEENKTTPGAEPAKETPSKDAPQGKGVKKAVHHIFSKIQTKTGLDDKKVDEFQKKWFAIPENRTKYEHLKNVPDVVGEELFAMFNDIIDFVQDQEGGKSHVFASLKNEAMEIKKDPKAFAQFVYGKGKSIFGKGVAIVKNLFTKIQEKKAAAVPAEAPKPAETPEEEKVKVEEKPTPATAPAPKEKKVEVKKPAKAKKEVKKPVAKEKTKTKKEEKPAAKKTAKKPAKK
ncbi:hypothetical protein HZA41_01430 [Candidatus Peregrinibacteria bacterium]|nr:hypothetical protein [Candidatus Peregrinibacteria bacterium]